MTKEYYLCNQAVIDYFPNAEKSKPFKSGYTFDAYDNYYIAVLDFDECVKAYNKKATKSSKALFIEECVNGNMCVKRINLETAKEKGLFVEIENKMLLTKMSNRAMVIKNLADAKKLTPIELINIKI